MKIYVVEITPQVQQYICRFLDFLPLNEKREITSIQNNLDKMNSLTSKILTRQFLSEHCNFETRPTDWVFNTTSETETFVTYLSHKTKVFFRISHCKGIFSIAISPKDNIEIDIKPYSYYTDYENTIPVLSVPEIKKITHLPSFVKSAKFIKSWTAQRAYKSLFSINSTFDLQKLRIQNHRANHNSIYEKINSRNLTIYNKTIQFSKYSFSLSVCCNEITDKHFPSIIQLNTKQLVDLLNKDKGGIKDCDYKKMSLKLQLLQATKPNYKC